MKRRQTKLFAGMDCLPGQGDLFQTDGPALPSERPPAPAYTCPNGHRVDWSIDDDDTAPTCHRCGLIASSYNAAEFTVSTWTPLEQHERQREALQDALDDAFENQYFSGGW